MRRADRLFQIVQNLHHTRVITAYELAELFSVSERTIYRDIQDLSLSGVPITGEPGHGYRLLHGYHLPPLMFTEEELEALLLGARMVRAWTDKEMAKNANQALSKIEHILPDRLKPALEKQELIVPEYPMPGTTSDQLHIVRQAIREQCKIQIDYVREDQESSSRIVHPLGLVYWGKVWTLIAWCELRDAFRHFRLDRMNIVVKLRHKYETVAGRTLQDYLDGECRTRSN